MINTFSIRFKAGFLMLIFSLNIVVGFACSIGIDFSFNSKHHHQEESAEIHIHADGKKHEHKKESHKHNQEENEKKDNCCTEGVVKISQADKAVSYSVKILHPFFFNAFVAAYYYIDIYYPSQVKLSTKYFVRGHHPPIADIRIAIQSFQI